MVVVTFRPLAKLLPVTTTVAVVPLGMVLGLSLLIPGWGSTVRQPEQVADPAGVVTVTLPGPSVAVADRVTFAVIEVELTYCRLFRVMPAAEKDSVELVVKSVPVKVSVSLPR